MGQLDFEGYKRRLDGFEYRAKRKDTPSDIRELLGLAQDMELEDRIIVDRERDDE